MSLFVFIQHGSPAKIGRGTQSDAHALIGIANRDRVLNPITAQPITEAQVAALGVEVFDVAAELKRSRDAIREAEQDKLSGHPGKAFATQQQQEAAAIKWRERILRKETRRQAAAR